jgi:hypothetical protein
MTGVAPRSAFEAMMAPRRLQSLAAGVQAVAAAVSSARSTSSVVAKTGFRAAVEANARGTDARGLVELEDALRVYVSDAPTKMARVNRDQATFLFVVMLQTVWL